MDRRADSATGVDDRVGLAGPPMSKCAPGASWRDSADDLAHGWDPESDDGESSLDAPESDVVEMGGWHPDPSQPSIGNASPDENSHLENFSVHLSPESRGKAGSAIVPTRQMPPPSGSGTPMAQRFPRPGEIVAHFRINSELGQGAFARVYLAEQLNLADRPVALKVSAALGDEPRNLARLQHTHIVPIHSVHDDPDTGWRLICMPYVGGANLAEILRGAGAYLPSLATGGSLIDALDRMGHGVSATGASLVETGPSRPDGSSGPAVISGEFALSSGESIDVATGGIGSPSRARSIWGRYFARLPWWNDLAGHDPVPNEQEEREPARRYLRSATYVQAAVWIVARLAEGLQHAHDRGLLHRDIKPSNILIAADGTPMLLDFNLSAELVEDPNEDGEQARARLGGTLPYMAPEHLDAFSGQGTTPPEAVGTAADIYALGLILFEMVAGQHPFSDPPPGPGWARRSA